VRVCKGGPWAWLRSQADPVFSAHGLSLSPSPCGQIPPPPLGSLGTLESGVVLGLGKGRLMAGDLGVISASGGWLARKR